MLARAYCAGILGVEGYLVTAEADVRVGLPGLVVVGRATGAVHETRERVRSALSHCGCDVRPRRQIVNLAPADRRKDSPGVDLAVACALLSAHELVPQEVLSRTMLWGELGLDGEIRPAAGTLIVADCARRHGFTSVVVHPDSAEEASLIPGLVVLPAPSLPRLLGHLRGDAPIEPYRPDPSRESATPTHGPDLADVRGQLLGRFAIEVMIAGGHNLLLHGPPGVGKTMLARRAAHLLPELEADEALEVTKIHSVARGAAPQGLQRRPPVRMPHHTVSVPGLLGGGTPARPGEVSLAHRGVLFLDELLEFPRACLESLREPLEDGVVSVVRANYAVRFPARFQLLAAMNPCPCGYLHHPARACVCPVAAVQRYQQRLSGPLLDRIDLVVPLAPVSPEAGERNDARSSAEARTVIEAARRRQRERLVDTPWRNNAEIPAEGGAIERWCPLDARASRLLDELARARQLSPRGRHRMRRVARTIGDLDRPDAPHDEPIQASDLAKAAALRRLPEGGGRA